MHSEFNLTVDGIRCREDGPSTHEIRITTASVTMAAIALKGWSVRPAPERTDLLHGIADSLPARTRQAARVVVPGAFESDGYDRVPNSAPVVLS
jgi:hypothetical protein